MLRAPVGQYEKPYYPEYSSTNWTKKARAFPDFSSIGSEIWSKKLGDIAIMKAVNTTKDIPKKR